MIPVTKPFLPPEEEYFELVKGAFNRNWLTNNGPLLNELELKLKEFLGVDHGIVVNNGTIALQIAIKALGMTGKVLTTPFSYIATASSLAWEGCTPIFVDIEPNSFNVSVEGLARHIDDDINGIVLTHCFGMPLDVKGIDAFAEKAGIPVIYDAAHAFGTTVDGKSIFEYGDISTCSFHATKLYHMIEGGGIYTKNPDLLKKCAWMRNFGHDGPESFHGVGINGKNSEVHAAMGLVNLRYAHAILNRRKEQCEHYYELLRHEPSIQLPELKNEGWNFAYFPILFKDEPSTIHAITELNRNGVFPRRYFYPSLNTANIWEATCYNSVEKSKRVLCLPLYHELTSSEQQLTTRLLLRTTRNR
jgi:dTDP-4-amino-4,6-dideoxygalactose transaminase